MIRHEPDRTRFVRRTESGEATVTYAIDDGVMVLKSTFVPPEDRNQGHADDLVEAAFLYAQDNDLVVEPACPYISNTWLERHPDYKHLTA